MQVHPRVSAPGGDAVGEHPHHRVVVRARQLPVRPRSAEQLEERILAPFLRRARRDDLLRQHVQRCPRNPHRVEIPLADGAHQRGALHQLVPGHGEEDSLGDAAVLVAGSADPLEEHGDRSRRAELAHQIHGPDVDPQLERGGGHHHPQLSLLEALFCT
jgi:hypothetical protein